MNETPPNPIESPPDIIWAKPEPEDVKKEIDEIRRVVEKVLKISPDSPVYESATRDIALSLINGELTELSDDIWPKIENTDSYHDLSDGDIEKAREIAASYKRDIDRFIDVAAKREEIITPMVLDYGEGLHLVSGNTRLMTARALNQTPKVIIGKYKPQ